MKPLTNMNKRNTIGQYNARMKKKENFTSIVTVGNVFETIPVLTIRELYCRTLGVFWKGIAFESESFKKIELAQSIFTQIPNTIEEV